MLMNSFFIKLAMLVLFLLAITCLWGALMMTFPVTLWNILLGIVGVFFLLRALEIADKINKFGPHSDEDQKQDKE